MELRNQWIEAGISVNPGPTHWMPLPDPPAVEAEGHSV